MAINKRVYDATQGPGGPPIPIGVPHDVPMGEDRKVESTVPAFMPPGQAGARGSQGTQGISSPIVDGRDGGLGFPGIAGRQGTSGRDGATIPGRDGRDGDWAPPGTKGDKGDAGPQGERGISTDPFSFEMLADPPITLSADLRFLLTSSLG